MGRPAARPDDETAQRYLTTGWDLVKTKLGYGTPAANSPAEADDMPEFPLLGLIGPTDVISEDETTGGFYRRWPSKAHYLADLMRYILDNRRMMNGTPDQRSRDLLLQLKEGPSFPEFVQAAARQEMDSLNDDPAFGVELHMWAAARTHDWVRDLMARGYAEATEHWSDAYGLILMIYGLRLRRGFDERRLAVVLTALLDGLALRRGLEPDAVDDDLFPDAVLGLLLGLLEPQGAPDHKSILEAFEQTLGADEPVGLSASSRSPR